MTTDYYSDCPVCAKPSTLWKHYDYQMWRHIECEVCKPMLLLDNLVNSSELSELQKIVIYCENRRHHEGVTDGKLLKLDGSVIEQFCSNYPNYTATELLDNFLSACCKGNEPGQEIIVNTLDVSIMASSRSFKSCHWILSQCNQLDWFDLYEEYVGFGHKPSSTNCSLTISHEGWKRYYELNYSNKFSKQAFMAMSFSNADLREIVLPAIKSTCLKAGYELLAVNEKRQAGLIDDKIRVDIRNSRFLVVDISDQNQGAYFEAGFAEGLGKPVFYICDEEVFKRHHNRKDGEKTVHFDVEHHDIIQWNKNTPEIAAEELLASIRNTLPNEANMVT